VERTPSPKVSGRRPYEDVGVEDKKNRLAKGVKPGDINIRADGGTNKVGSGRADAE